MNKLRVPITADFDRGNNAKHLNARQVALNFVYSEHLNQLMSTPNVVLLGPRGSGKTTLMKMLLPDALFAWRGEHANIFREKIKFSGVLVESGIAWSKQVNSIGDGKLDPDVHKAVVVACFSNAVFQSLIKTIATRNSDSAHLPALLSPDQEKYLVNAVARILHITPNIASIRSLQDELEFKMTDIRTLGNKWSKFGREDQKEALAKEDWFHVDFLSAVDAITSCHNRLVHEPNHKWALLIDEFETANDWIVDQLFSSLRSSAGNNLIFKLAISPISRSASRVLQQEDGPTQVHDFSMIKLWQESSASRKVFCRGLWKQIATHAGVCKSSREALGLSLSEAIRGNEINFGQLFSDKTATIRLLSRRSRETGPNDPYGKNGGWTIFLQELTKKDKTFAATIRSRGIDLNEPDSWLQSDKDETLRKAIPTALVRYHYSKIDTLGAKSGRRSRKRAPTLYFGETALFAAAEGNPRVFITLANGLIEKLRHANRVPISPAEQQQALEEVSRAMFALARTIAVSDDEFSHASPKNRSLEEFLRKVGNSFRDSLVTGKFNLDPNSGFTVDNGANPFLLELVEKGLNRGVLVLANDEESGILASAQGARVRLSYLVSASFGLPLRSAGKYPNLSSLIQSSQLSLGL